MNDMTPRARVAHPELLCTECVYLEKHWIVPELCTNPRAPKSPVDGKPMHEMALTVKQGNAGYPCTPKRR